MNKALHTTDDYSVAYEPDVSVKAGGFEYTGAYVVWRNCPVNGLINEFVSPQYPEAIAAAEGLALALRREPWKWERDAWDAQEAANAVNPDGSAVH